VRPKISRQAVNRSRAGSSSVEKRKVGGFPFDSLGNDVVLIVPTCAH
jgi:hypothetical protein